MALTPKQVRFVKEYLVDQNASKAARRSGYSLKTAPKIGSENLQKPEIAAEIKKGLDAQLQTAVKRAAARGMTKERWLKEVEAIAMANMDDYATIEGLETYNGVEGEPQIYHSVQAKLTKDRPRRFGKAIKKISETKNGIGIELHSKQAALDTLGKHYGWLKNEVELNLPDSGVQVIVTIPSNGREAPKKIEPESGNGSAAT